MVSYKLFFWGRLMILSGNKPTRQENDMKMNMPSWRGKIDDWNSQIVVRGMRCEKLAAIVGAIIWS
jgi:hypothetical protein